MQLIACLIHDQANIGGAIAPPAPMVPTPMWGIHRDGMRSTYYPGVRTKPGTYYQGWFMYRRYTQGQNE